ncbi:hypothetical protein HYDPIDRAFT_115606 [Hydnomerulius pinastri MD-312]|uniref:VWFA domain-containing protein n=1 Tax=Hydnomerulius pinastri MD-312 TaxID=994086 RepID=A0A0C9WC52_9AGAM|nr:hypothetical protein HYDPIDRAFT_115606 [Hydnomerulius pinastri MD-312]
MYPNGRVSPNDNASSYESDTHSSDVDMSEDDTDDLYESVYDDALEGPQDHMVIDPPRAILEQDLVDSIKGMYRLLDLISEQGSGGLVDKIIIAQDSLQSFINTICPGAYASLTKVNFKILDRYIVKPVGIYGGKEEIVRLMLSLGVVDDLLASKLLFQGGDSVARATLRSGLYILRTSPKPGSEEQIFVIYWPEETTWDDMAASSVRRNRVTFIRYLTKMCDQVIALISPEHAKSIVWSERDSDDELPEKDQDESDRMFTFEVAKTNEQEESVSVRQGFKYTTEVIDIPERHPECKVDPDYFKPRLLGGETTQGILTVRYRPSRRIAEVYNSQRFNELQLETLVKNDALVISETLNLEALQILVRLGLDKRYPRECEAWRQEVLEVRQRSRAQADDEKKTMKEKLQETEPLLTGLLMDEVIENIVKIFPILDDALAQAPTPLDGGMDLQGVISLHPRIGEQLREELRRADLKRVPDSEFKRLKGQFCFIGFLSRKFGQIDETRWVTLIDSILHENREQMKVTLVGIVRSAPPNDRSRSWSLTTSWEDRYVDKLIREADEELIRTSDVAFVSGLKDLTACMPILEEVAKAIKESLKTHFELVATRLSKKLTHVALRIQEDDYSKQIEREVTARNEVILHDLGHALIRKINALSKSAPISHTLRIESVEQRKGLSYWSSTSYELTGSRESMEDPMLLFTVHLMQLTAQDQHDLQLVPTTIPTPRLKPSHSFRLPLDFSIGHAQLLEGERLLLVVIDRTGNLLIFLDNLAAMENAIDRGRAKILHRDKIGQEFMLAFDESKRMLAVVASEKLHLHVFVYDDTRGFQASGSAINMTSWYNEGVTIVHACFISGSEELLLVDSQALARIYSLTTMQFRPATLNLPEIPVAIHSSPDGSCFLAFFSDSHDPKVVAFHWSTFGSTEGIALAIPGFSPGDPLSLTSIVSRASIHLVKLDISAHACQSVALDITRKVTEFMFKEKGVRGHSAGGSNFTAHNCLLDCHVEVWTRFPVLPAVQRSTISSSSSRLTRRLLFVTDRDHRLVPAHFSGLIETFERTTKKPTGDLLRSLTVTAVSFGVFADEFKTNRQWTVSKFKAGEWIVDFLCLIPIHIAVAKENRFMPLKDGVYSPEMEKSLLGADVNRIVDSISFGWYESLFQSYMADKPVRVVSSMGEQSVGKSFALNHLVDTSFAGSAMRTTEGVWMSVTPTDDALIVALDFEGVHSIERSAQEDTLLVLFNTAISNLVLFRNNFALSRDITGLFQSFQSSSTVLDPAANPSLFQSTLVIIIKDVVDSDKNEIAREFSLKFQRIVQDEQEANFISRLHAGKLNIIPWPVIESKEFYRLFPALKRRLDQQVLTHRAAGEFLHLMKTLMAKLKANDWGALSQTMASHRAQLLLNLLPNALTYGLQEVDPDIEPLKNLDTDSPVEMPDTDAHFFIPSTDPITSQAESRERALNILREGWDRYRGRHLTLDEEWTEGLGQFLENLVSSRIEHVREWMSSNLSRFQAGNASIVELRRTLESAIVDLKSGVQLCKMKCASCHLSCIQSRLHDGHHDCQTNHICAHTCDFCKELQEESKQCSVTAGHPGKHVCLVNAHLCGKPCKLLGKSGCLEECTKVVDHTDADHECSATVHACGQPCDLSLVPLPDGSMYTCTGNCGVPSNVEHDRHQCDARMCAISCQLCRRLCSNRDHLHGLEEGAVHLCGQEHSCSQLCTAPGICEIDMAPQSIEATFTGRHETFQYTRYSQVAKRLKCVKLIPPTDTAHVGAHNHSSDDTTFHFCKVRCASCGYFCTLPLGHSQQEHDTRHGSMAQARWSIDGPDDEGLEVDGRRFSTNDEGAPMLCNLVCQALGRHVHVDYCRAEDSTACTGNEDIQHTTRRMQPNPDRQKDFLTHSLYWKRSGFKDPYSREEQTAFAKCDAMCSGPEHTAAAGNIAQPSYCTLPLFHPPMNPNTPPEGLGYVSNDGHHFSCRNPVVMQQAFHVMFLIDRSGSMTYRDRQPLPSTPVYAKICARSNNRLGAVYSSLYSFWTARATASAHSHASRRDSYSVIMHDDKQAIVCVNDFTSSPDQLLDMVLPYIACGGNDFDGVIRCAQATMEQNWSTERTPVIIFLSDGIWTITDQIMQDLCRSATRLGKPLSFHSVSFGPDADSSTLRRMTQIALDAQNNAPRDPLAPAAASVLSTFSQALDTVQLAETFLGIAESLRKPRGSLMH